MTENRFKGKTVVLTGTLTQMGRKDVYKRQNNTARELVVPWSKAMMYFLSVMVLFLRVLGTLIK